MELSEVCIILIVLFSIIFLIVGLLVGKPYGYIVAKEEMSKEAIEGEVYKVIFKDGNPRTSIIVDIPSEELDDKIKLVIIKED